MALDTQWHKTDEELESAVRKDTGVVVRKHLRLVDIAHDAGTSSVLWYAGVECHEVSTPTFSPRFGCC